MPKTRQSKSGPLADFAAKIKEAERKSLPIGRENIGLDQEGYDALLLLVQRGIGVKTEVLRQALATGLRVLKQSSEPEPDYEAMTEREPTLDIPPLGQAITTPPSVQRRQQEEGDIAEEPAE